MSFEDFANDENSWIVYGDEDSGDRLFLRRCPECSRFVKADVRCFINDNSKTNATCKTHGRIRMAEM